MGGGLLPEVPMSLKGAQGQGHRPHEYVCPGGRELWTRDPQLCRPLKSRVSIPRPVPLGLASVSPGQITSKNRLQGESNGDEELPGFSTQDLSIHGCSVHSAQVRAHAAAAEGREPPGTAAVPAAPAPAL
ncbi:hypothetical protein E5288_WYG016152 [Bos mutus]|uniref:Uncharacterized protein n=1 Tax=Bos mutus TaxID=72004 RepID=A0A6B0RK45_9CETA|nr:hypothetical protein [Bos mutus]